MTRDDVLQEVAGRLCAPDLCHPVRVGIDGVCGVGKTVFAVDLAERITALGRPAIVLDSDGFHHVRAVRHRQGTRSARGYYDDAYDFDALRDLALEPLGPRGSRRYAAKVHDLTTDAVVREWDDAPADAVVLFAATFVQRGDLRDHWDEVVFLDAAPATARARGVARDAPATGGIERAASAYDERYGAACAIYLAQEDPRSRASIVIDHDDPQHPRVLR